MSIVKDFVEVVFDFDEKFVYFYIVYESVEDIIRIIFFIDVEWVRFCGEVIYYMDDWDDLIRQRIVKGKRYMVFDFYNFVFFDIWEVKVKKVKILKKVEKIVYVLYGVVIVVLIGFLVLFGFFVIFLVLLIVLFFFFLDGGLGIEWILVIMN